MNRQFRTRQVFIFFCIAYAWTWLFFVPLALSTAGLGWLPFHLSIPIMTVLGTFGPTISGVLTLRLTEHRWPGKRSIKSARQFFLGLLLAPLLVFLTYAAVPAIILVKVPVSALQWSALASLSFYDLSTVLGGPLFEEPGWRGFALSRLQDLLGPSRAALLLGFMWWGWHLPLFLCKFWSSSGAGAYLLIVVGLSFLFTFLYNLSWGSVVVTIVAHAAFNTCSRWLGALLGNAPLRDYPSPEIVMGLSGLLVAVTLVIATGGQLATRRYLTMPPLDGSHL